MLHGMTANDLPTVSGDVTGDVRTYAKADLARKHRSTAGTQQAVDPALVARLMTDVERDGFVVVPGVLRPDEVDAIRADVLPRLVHPGRNVFEGLATRRLYGVLAKTAVCDPLVEHPLILALLDRVLEPNYLLSQLQVIDIQPGEKPQPLHFDDGFYAWPRPRRALGAATIWPLDDFTTENGATVVVPRSHLWGDRMPDARAPAMPVVMPRGAVLFFLGTLWHGGGENRAGTARACVTAQYCAPWCRQQENFSLSVPIDRVRRSSEHLQRMIGYSIHPPFMGFVDGMHPKRLLGDDGVRRPAHEP
jgi:ectoine hydroxylase-related dioxygenase (phytanoyl-CoA dioxygenase family)